jgi:hypothetical protein
METQNQAMVQDIVAEDFIQHTGRANYQKAGDLEGPEKLLEMGEAAKDGP